MSDDMIYRQAAIRWVKIECNPYGNPTLDFESGKKFIEHLKQMPAAEQESEEIIKCSECVHSSYEPCKNFTNVYVCNYNQWRRSEGGRYPNDFCSQGERRNDATFN